jgi:hypothetical protein
MFVYRTILLLTAQSKIRKVDCRYVSASVDRRMARLFASQKAWKPCGFCLMLGTGNVIFSLRINSFQVQKTYSIQKET